MSVDEDDKFLDELSAARPALQPSAEQWLGDDRGRQVLERVLAVAENGAPRIAPARADGGARRAGRAKAWWWRGPRLAVACGLVALAVLAVSLAIVFADGAPDRGPIAAGQVSKLSAIEDLMPVYGLKTGQTFDSLTRPTPDSLAGVDEAVGSGLLTEAEVLSGAAAKPMTKAQYAVLLVKAFRTILPRGTHPTLPVDATATADEQAAIDTLVASGIILPSDGLFRGSEALTTDVESRLLQRVEEALKRLTSG